MMRVIRLVAIALLVTLTTSAVSRLEAKNAGPFTVIISTWRVVFENGVKETCEVDKSGDAVEKEPLRTAKGKAERQDKAFIIKFEDDRVERWTPVGGRMTVEHWFPASQYPNGPRVLGIAERTQ